MKQAEIKQQVAMLANANHSYIEIARRLDIASSYVGRILADLRRNGVLPQPARRPQRIPSRLTQPVDPKKLREAVKAVELAIDQYATVAEDSPSNVLCFLSTRETVEVGVQLIGLSGADGQDTSAAVVQALAHVLESHGYEVPALSGFTPIR